MNKFENNNNFKAYVRHRALTQSLLTAFMLLGLLFGLEDGGSTFLRNFGKLLSDYMASYPCK
jgi:membrane-bound metal-dependent hydrolase YbcI (DUF457 family)